MVNSVVRRSASLTGRDDELVLVRAHLAAAGEFTRAKSRLMVIDGPSGIGKTRLLAEAHRTLDPEGRWLHIECMQFSDERCGATSLGFARLRGPTNRALPPTTGSFEQTLVDGILDEVDRGLSVVVVDDLQWADPGTVEVVRRLLDQIDTASVRPALLATLRTDNDDVHESTLGILRHPLSSRMTLAGLSPSDGAELLLAFGVPITLNDTLERLSILADGNALLLQEIAVKLAALGSTAATRVDDVPDLTHLIEFPQGVADEARRRVEALDARLGLALTVLALHRDTAETGIIELLERLGIDGEEALDDAEAADLITRNGNVRISHPSIEHALLAAASPPKTRQLHRQIGAALRKSSTVSIDSEQSDDAIGIVHHLRLGRAVLDDDTMTLADRARVSALQRHDWPQVARICEYVREHALQSKRPVDLGALLLDAGVAHFMLGEGEAATQILGEAAEQFRIAGDVDGIVYALVGRSRVHGTFQSIHDDPGSTKRIEAELEAMLDRIDGSRPDLAAELRADLAFGAWVRWDFDAALELCAAALDVDAELSPLTARVRALTCRGLVEYTTCNAGDAVESLQLACSLAREAGDAVIVATPAFRLPYALTSAGELRAAGVAADDALGLVTGLKITSFKLFAASAVLTCAAARGDGDAIDSLWRSIRHWGSGNGEVMATANAGLAAAMAASIRGETTLALERLDEAVSPLFGRNSLDNNPIGRAYATLVRSEEPTGLSASQPAESVAMPGGPTDLLTVVAASLAIEVARLAGSSAAAQADITLETAIERGQRVSSGHPTILERSLGLSYALRGDDRSLQMLRHALATARRESMQAELARTILDLVEQRLVGDDEQATLVEELANTIVEFDFAGLLHRLDVVDAAAASVVRARLQHRRQPLVADEAIIFFADVVNSTRWNLELGSVEYRRRARTVERHLRQVVATNGGRVGEGITLGDGLYAEFANASAAMSAGLEVSDRLGDSELQVRVGIHRGEVAREGNAIFGTALNIAARTSDRADPGNLMISKSAVAGLRSDLRERLVDEGGFTMKGVDEQVQLYSCNGLDR